MRKEQFDTGGDMVFQTSVEPRERILTPLHHSFVIGISWTIAAMLLFLTLSIAVAEQNPDNGASNTIMFLGSAAAGVLGFVWAYTKRDAWLRHSTSQNITTVDPVSQVHSPNPTTPVAPAVNGVDSFMRVSDSLLIRLQLPPELGITNQNIMDLALKIQGGNLDWSKRALKGYVPENSYTEFSNILKGRGVLRNAPNKSYALTQKGVDVFCNPVDTGVPPPTTTT